MITYLYFIRPVFVGGAAIEMWSGRSGETSALMKALTVVDRKDMGVVLQYRAGPQMHDITVPMSNISQVTRDVAAEHTKEKR